MSGDGVGVGEVRLTIEAGESTRFLVRGLLGKGPVSADRLIEVLPRLTADLTAVLKRKKEREARE